MDFPAVLATLNDLPSTFQRPSSWVTQMLDGLGFEIAVGTQGTDGTMAQVQSVNAAQDGWLDVWGLLMNVPRNSGEGNTPYLARISNTVLAAVGTLNAIQIWINLFAPGGSVAANASGLGYTISLPSALTPAQASAFLASLSRIRPAGVPFSAVQGAGALYAGTVEFAGLGQIMGSYLSASSNSSGAAFGATALSAVPMLPTLYMTDPTLNPSLAPGSTTPVANGRISTNANTGGNSVNTTAFAAWFAGLPTALPSTGGQPWNNAGVLSLS